MTALGVALLAIGAIVILAEAHVQSLGILGGPGVVLLAVGAVLAVGGLGGGIALGLASALVLAMAGAAVLALTLRKGMAVRRRRIRTGREGMIGHLGIVRTWVGTSGSVLVDGALWRARCAPESHEQPRELHEGDPIVVEHLSGLTLSVRRAEEWELMP
jgi:membrane-bound serine protease (ClpP class)